MSKSSVTPKPAAVPLRRHPITSQDRLGLLVEEAEQAPIELTRGGEPVAVILSLAEYRRLASVAETEDPPAIWRPFAGYPQSRACGKGVSIGDIVSPVVPREAWDAERDNP
jgi:prevent-host-death family protein